MAIHVREWGKYKEENWLKSNTLENSPHQRTLVT